MLMELSLQVAMPEYLGANDTSPAHTARIKKYIVILALLATYAAASFAQSSQTTDHGDDTKPIAILQGQPLYEKDILPYIASNLLTLRKQEFDIKRDGLEQLINQKLLEVEARKKGLSGQEFLAREVDAKIADPTEAELNAFYLAQKTRTNRPMDEIRAQLIDSLKQAKVQQARQAFYAQLRDREQLTILLQSPKVEITYDSDRLRGNPKAPVVIVEFADFQCPYCQAAEPTLKNILVKYNGRVALAFRDLPLRQLHPLAETAAEAARCAGEQGKFWQYHDFLFASSSSVEHENLLREARQLNLYESQFGSCLTGEKYKTLIQRDFDDAVRAGASGTPSFFINGTYLNGNVPEAVFERTIEDELSALQIKRVP
jgi:protein-disulfide isomerase